MQSEKFSYDRYLEIISGTGLDLSPQDSDLIIQRFRKPAPVISRFVPVTYLLDYSTKKYIYVDEACFNLLGYKASYFMEGGLENYKSKWHPADFEIINNKIFPQNFNFIKEVPQSEYNNYIFSYNHRTLNAKGEYIMVLQRSSFIKGQDPGLPAGVIGVVFDITHFKNDISVTHTIEKTVYFDGSPVNELVYKKKYPVIEISEMKGISKRELEVLRFISAGFSSKQIAGKLNLSMNTVNNHRKAMLKKTGLKNLTELLNHAIRQGMI